MGMAYRLAHKLAVVGGQDVVRVERMLARSGLPLARAELAPQPLSVDALMASMAKDKKASSGNLVFIVPTAIGASEVRKDVPRELVAEVLTEWLEA